MMTPPTQRLFTRLLVATWGALAGPHAIALWAQVPVPPATPPAAPDESKAGETRAQPDGVQPANTAPASPAQSPSSPAVGAGLPDREPALKGYCPVAYLSQGKATKGDPAYRSTYAGEVYQFSSAEAKQQFDADPPKFLPQFAGWCTTALGGPYRNRLPSDPEVFDVRDGKVYLFSCERAKRAYDKQPERFIANAVREFATPAIGGYSPVAYQARNKAIPGTVDYQAQYRGKVYWFATGTERDTFVRDQERYVPAYDGYCAEGVSRGKRYPAQPDQFAVHEGRTYLFYDAKARVTFMINPPESVKLADSQWATLKDQPRLP